MARRTQPSKFGTKRTITGVQLGRNGQIVDNYHNRVLVRILSTYNKPKQVNRPAGNKRKRTNRISNLYIKMV